MEEKTTHNRVKKKVQNRQVEFPVVYLVAGAVLAAVILIIVFGGRGCSGGSQKTPEDTVRSLTDAFVDGDERKVLKYYGVQTDVPVDVQTEVDAQMAYYRAHHASSVNYVSADTLFNQGDYAYVYVIFDLVLGDSQKYPCIKTYMTQNSSGGYIIVSSSHITEELSEKAVQAYTKLMTTDQYKTYTMDYETFIRKNPDYEETIAGSISGEAAA